MEIDYKFSYQKKSLFEQLLFADENDDQDKSDENKKDQDAQPLELNREIINQSIELMQQEESPLQTLELTYPESYPAFDRNFLYVFSEYYCKNLPDCDYLLEKTVFSNKENAFQLVTMNILDFLYLKLPATFGIIQKMMESNELYVRYFLSTGGLFVLIYFSKDPDCQLAVSSLFKFLTRSMVCEIHSQMAIMAPKCLEGFFSQEEEINYDIFFQTLLFSENREVQINCLKSIRNLFKVGRNEIESLELLLIEKFYKMIQIPEYENLLTYIMQASYFFNVGIFSKDFLSICHHIFQNNLEIALKPALFFVSKSMDFIVTDEQISDCIFEDLFLFFENGAFIVSRLASFDLIHFMSICNNRFYEPSFEKGLFQCISNIFLTFDPSLEEEVDFKFVLEKLTIFLKKLVKNENQTSYENRKVELNDLIESLRPLFEYNYDWIHKLTKKCISLINRLLDIKTEEEESDEEFDRLLFQADMGNPIVSII